MSDEKFIRIAIEESEKGDFPFGAVIVKEGEVIAKTHNTAGGLDPSAHAEVNVIRDACKKLGRKYLEDCILYSSCEPCTMCYMVAFWARIHKIVYAADEKDVPDKSWITNIDINKLNEVSSRDIELKRGVLREEALKIFERYNKKANIQ